MVSEKRDREKRRQEIRQAALRLVGTQGLHRLTTGELARAVGLTDGALFRHFRDKSEIIMAAIERFEELLMEGFPPDEEHPLKRLRCFFMKRLGILREHPEIKVLAFNEQLGQLATEEGARRVREVIKASQGFVYGCLKEAQAERMIGDDIPLEMLTWAVVGVIRGVANTLVSGEKDTKDVNTAEHQGGKIEKKEQDEAIFEAYWLGLEQMLRRSK